MIRSMFHRLGQPGPFLAAAVFAALPALGLADTVWYSSGGTGGAVQVEGAIQKVQDGELVWLSKNGNSAQRPMTSVVKVKADGEASLNEAEEAFEAKKFDVAAAAYDKAITSSRKEWVKERAVFRLVQAAAEAGQFPLSAKAFVQLAGRDPAAAADKKPPIPADKAQVAKAIPDVERAFAMKQTDVVRGFLGELYIANDEPEKAMKLLASAPGADKNPVIILTQAKASLAGKNYAAALDIVQKNRVLFTDSTQQLDALFTMAESQAGLAAADPAKKQDAAIAYMRVVAHSGGRNSPMVTNALLKTATLLEEIGQFAEAAAIHKQMAEDPKYAGSKIATDAKANYERLSKKEK